MIKNQEVVFHTVARSDVHAARSLFQRDKIRKQDRRQPSGQRPFSLQPLEPLAPFPHAQHTIVMQTAGLCHAIDEFVRDDEDLLVHRDEGIHNPRMQTHSLVGR